jgi:hypothetical protein
LTFKEFSAHFASLRAASSNLRIVREQIVVDSNFLEAHNRFSCDFMDVFTYSPIGPLEPTGEHLGLEAINAFRHYDDGRLAWKRCRPTTAASFTKLGDDHDGVRPTGNANAKRSRPHHALLPGARPEVAPTCFTEEFRMRIAKADVGEAIRAALLARRVFP